MLDSEFLTQTQDDLVKHWHIEPKLNDNFDNLTKAILTNHFFNFKLWHEEDEARRKDVNDSIIANVKRNIDSFNQQRNDQIELMDTFLIEELIKRNITNDNLPMNSETPGAIIDKLSILSLKINHMAEQTERADVNQEHIDKCNKKLEMLKEQRKDLANNLNSLTKDIFQGKKKLKVYKQFKMYNNHNLNPKLYESFR